MAVEPRRLQLQRDPVSEGSPPSSDQRGQRALHDAHVQLIETKPQLELRKGQLATDQCVRWFMIRGMTKQTRNRLYAAVAVVAAIGYILLLWRGPWWIDGAHLRARNLQPADGVVITGFRTMLVAVGAGAVAVLGLYYTHRTHQHAEKLYAHSQEQFDHSREKDREQVELTREGQVTGRYVEAIKLLGSSNLYERLGGIYSLERIMNDSDKDHRTVVEVLSAFIRTPVCASTESGTATDAAGQGNSEPHRRESPAPDTTAALAVIGRQPARGNASMTDLRGAYLAGTILRDISLPDANLQGSDLTGVVLESADLSGSHMASATLTGACLRECDLSQIIAPEIDLTGATVEATTLTNAVLPRARLVGADLSSGQLLHADMTRADLTGACMARASLRYARLEHAVLNQATLEGADLTHADLVGAVLIDADLTGAGLDKANLAHADLDGALLAGARLGTAHGLSVRQLVKAHITEETELPERLARDPQITARITECEASETGQTL